jgi:RHS repeat-associated protein
MAAPRARAVLLGLVLALSAAVSPAAASLIDLHGPHGLAGGGLAAEHVLELLQETARAQQAQDLAQPSGDSAFTLWPGPPPPDGQLFARTPEPPLLKPAVPELELLLEDAGSLAETRIRAFGLFEPYLRLGSSRVSRETATGYTLGMREAYVGPTQKALWTDPVTGMAYARAHWLDTRTAAWLSEDPAGDVDSVNLYAFVGWQPTMATDPLGEQTDPEKLHVPQGFLWQAYMGYAGAATNQENSVAARVGYGSLALLYAVPAGVEEIGRGLANIPYGVTKNTVEASERLAEAELEPVPEERLKLRSEAVGRLCFAFCEAGTAAVPASSTAKSPVLNTLRGWWGRLTGGSIAVADQALIAERRAIAERFYRQSGYDEAAIADHLRGIDFTKPVEVVKIPKGTELVQYQIPGAPEGRYFAPSGTPGSQLGFYTSGRDAATYVATDDVQALRSVAASTVDDWSMRAYGWEVEAPGGGTQFFTTATELAKRP